MKTCVLISILSLTLCYDVYAFEYHEEYNTENDGRSLDESFKEFVEEYFNYYEPVATPLNMPNNDEHVPLNYISDEPNIKPSDTVPVAAPEASEVPKDDEKRDTKKPFYDEKDAPELFNKFIKDFNKQYKDDEEYNKRYQNFVNNLKEINRLNKEEEATFDINMFADLGEDESVIG